MGVVMTSTQAAGAASTIYMIVMLVIMFALMYFLMIRPQKKEQKRVTAMLNDMEVGDAIVTTGGFYGVIIDITDEDVFWIDPHILREFTVFYQMAVFTVDRHKIFWTGKGQYDF